eukprot:3045338-Amphidinium_carterae.1
MRQSTFCYCCAQPTVGANFSELHCRSQEDGPVSRSSANRSDYSEYSRLPSKVQELWVSCWLTIEATLVVDTVATASEPPMLSKHHYRCDDR